MPERMTAAGPLGKVIDLVGVGHYGADANPLIMLNRVAFLDAGKLADEGKRALLRWAVGNRLGQDATLAGAQAASLIAAVWQRRRAALDAAQGHVVRLVARPEWRLVVGLGNKANAYEIGLALHGTYGWPVIPGSALKGLAHAWASSQAEPDNVQRVLGAAGQRGSVCFLDAIPAGQPVTVVADVLTPHVKPYYDDVAAGRAQVRPPGEYHNPVPLQFLTVRGTFAVDLYGPVAADVDLAAEWLTKAGDELGTGAKTAAGYGHLTIEPA